MARPRAGEGHGRENLLDAAWAELVRGGGVQSRMSVASICAAAGCTPPTLYHHFADLSDLLRTAGRRAFDAWAADLARDVGNEPDPRRRLRSRAEAYVAWARRNPKAYQAMFAGSPQHPAAAPAPAEPGPAFGDLLLDVAALLGRPAQDPEVLPVAVAHWAAVHGLASLAISNPAVPEAIWTGALDRLVVALTGAPERSAEVRPPAEA